MSYLGPAVRGLFNSALISSKSSKDASQDGFRNLKIPMLESFAGQDPLVDDTWYDTSLPEGNSFTSILGLPILGVPSEGSTYFDLATSYMYADCSVTMNRSYTASVQPGFDSTNVTGSPSVYYSYLTIQYDALHTANSSSPRQLVVYDKGESGLTIATCSLATIFIEANVHCSEGVCDCTAGRRPSKVPHSTAITVLDLDDPIAALMFFTSFVSAPGITHDDESNPLEIYIVNPDSPYSLIGQLVDLADVGDDLFSQRFTQLLNTFWIAGIAPFAVTGNFTKNNTSALAAYGVQSANSLTESGQTILHCDIAWLVVLIVTSGVAFLAGLATAVFSAFRKGPDILSHFAIALRDNEYAQVPQKSSMESGAAMARRLKDVQVGLRDVRPYEAEGYTAIATLSDKATSRIVAERMYS